MESFYRADRAQTQTPRYEILLSVIFAVVTILLFARHFTTGEHEVSQSHSPVGFTYTGVIHREFDIIEEIGGILIETKNFTTTEAIDLATMLVMESEKRGIDPLLVMAVMKVESQFSPRVVSSKGAIGLMQVMPSTARFISARLGEEYRGASSLYDPQLNLYLGISYLAMLKDQFGSIETALVAYNFGPNSAVIRRVDLPERPPRYVRSVLRMKSQLEVAVRES